MSQYYCLSQKFELQHYDIQPLPSLDIITTNEPGCFKSRSICFPNFHL